MICSETDSVSTRQSWCSHDLSSRDVAKWTVIEAALGITAGCLPTTLPLLRLMIRKRTPPSRTSSSQGPPVTENWTCRTHVERGLGPSEDLDDGEILVCKSISQVRILNSGTGCDVGPRNETCH
ncbi:Transposon Ty3-I Gag-Pol polyprotein [Fusarium oxysporum f. sp. albedinis]|nr:Transposon Ty3-I Gag-Pol polyprotein [Fusarium oxysporum f. sp. albedinis]